MNEGELVRRYEEEQGPLQAWAPARYQLTRGVLGVSGGRVVFVAHEFGEEMRVESWPARPAPRVEPSLLGQRVLLGGGGFGAEVEVDADPDTMANLEEAWGGAPAAAGTAAAPAPSSWEAPADGSEWGAARGGSRWDAAPAASAQEAWAAPAAQAASPWEQAEAPAPKLSAPPSGGGGLEIEVTKRPGSARRRSTGRQPQRSRSAPPIEAERRGRRSRGPAKARVLAASSRPPVASRGSMTAVIALAMVVSVGALTGLSAVMRGSKAGTPNKERASRRRRQPLSAGERAERERQREQARRRAAGQAARQAQRSAAAREAQAAAVRRARLAQLQRRQLPLIEEALAEGRTDELGIRLAAKLGHDGAQELSRYGPPGEGSAERLSWALGLARWHDQEARRRLALAVAHAQEASLSSDMLRILARAEDWLFEPDHSQGMALLRAIMDTSMPTPEAQLAGLAITAMVSDRERGDGNLSRVLEMALQRMEFEALLEVLCDQVAPWALGLRDPVAERREARPR